MSVETLDIYCVDKKATHKSLTARIETAIVSAFETIQTWIELQHSRHELAKLDDHMLHDIGLDRATVQEEIEKPFWVK